MATADSNCSVNAPLISEDMSAEAKFKKLLTKVSAIVATVAVLLTNADRICGWLVDSKGRQLESQLQVSVRTAQDEIRRLDPEAKKLIERVKAARNWDSPIKVQDRVRETGEIIALLQTTYHTYIPGDANQKLEDGKLVLARAATLGGAITTEIFKKRFEADYEQLVDDEIDQWNKLVAETNIATKEAEQFVARKSSFDDFEKAVSRAAGPLTRRREDDSKPPTLYKSVCLELYPTARELDTHRRSRWWW